MSVPLEPDIRKHADHDPDLVCRPALGYGLCEVLVPHEDKSPQDVANDTPDGVSSGA